MENSNKPILILGYASVVAGLLVVVSNALTGWDVDAAFLVTTGLAVIVMAWLRERCIPDRNSEPISTKSKENFFHRNSGYFILGGFVFVGLLLISAPVLAILFGLIIEEEIPVMDEVVPLLETFRSLKEASGPTYYAFLLGLVYFLSPKNKGP